LRERKKMGIIDTILGWIGAFLGWLDGLTGNYLTAMFLFALIVEILMIPFGIKQQKNSRKQASLRPKEQAIRNRYKGRNDKATMQKVNEEIQQMYQEEHFNQLSGCLPLLLQFPIIIALYNVIVDPLKYVIGFTQEQINTLSAFVKAPVASSGLGIELTSNRGTIELANQIGSAAQSSSAMASLTKFAEENSSAIDVSAVQNAVYPDFSVFGINLAETPDIKKLSWLLIIPVLTFVVYFFSMKLSRKFTYQPAKSGDPATDKATGCSNWSMDIMMPLFSVYISFIVPAALGVYWIFKSILGTLKQFIMSKVMPMPQFTEEDYKAAEREYAGKAGKVKEYKVDFENRKSNANSLFREDEDDFSTPEDNSEIDKKLKEKDPEDTKGIITKASLKDDDRK